MSAVDLKEVLSLSWTACKPYHVHHPSRSPRFFFQGAECYFELRRITGSSYQLLFKFLNTIKCFDITSYVMYENEPIYFKYSQSDAINTFHELSQKMPNSYTSQTIDIFFIFHNNASIQLMNQKNSFYGHDSLSSDLGKLLDDGLYHDVELKCGDSIVKAHRNILATRSKVLQLKLKTGKVEIEDVVEAIFPDFVRYMYTGKLSNINLQNVKEFYKAGDKYAMKGLVRCCSDFLIEKLTERRACETLIFADDHEDEYLKECVTKYIIKNKIPLQNRWLLFSQSYPKLAYEVLHQAYMSMAG